MFGFKLIKIREWSKLNADLELAKINIDIWKSNYEEMKSMYEGVYEKSRKVAELEKELEQIKNENKEDALQVNVFDSECDSMGRCPACGYVVFCLDNYCKNCGQAIQTWNPWESRE